MEKKLKLKNNMPIRDKKAEQEFEAIPDRIYTHVELQDFYNKIQKYWDEPREVELKDGMSGIAQKFRHDDLHVAYGTARKVDSGGGRFHYLYSPERNRQFNVLWNQYESWQRKQDWIEKKESEAMSEIAEQESVPF